MSVYEIGLGRADITAWEPGMAMFGWSVFTQRVEGVSHRLHARAAVLREGGGAPLAIVCVDLGFVSQLLRAEVIERLLTRHRERGFCAHRVLLVATHTHAGPDGLTDALFYGAYNFGVSLGVLDHVADRVVEAIVAADASRFEARLRRGEDEVTPGVAFNRSLEAYNENRDVTPLPAEGARDAVDRGAGVLRVEDLAGRERGMIGWFACHATNLHADHRRLDGDFPARAMARVEARRGPDSPEPGGYVALLMQGSAGDLSPNFRTCPRRRWLVGVHEDDTENAERVAAHVADALVRALDRARGAAPVQGALRGSLRHVDFSQADIDPGFAGGARNPRTTPARLGFAMALGTREGAGPIDAARPLLLRWNDARRRYLRARGAIPDRDDDAKLEFSDLSRGLRGRFALLAPLGAVAALRPPDPAMRWWNALARAGLTVDRPLIPQVLPAQVLVVGDVTFAAICAEPTTVAGRRVARALSAAGARHPVVLGYANAYAGYVTTPEEYAAQRYEGGHTVFGRHTLAAWQTALVTAWAATAASARLVARQLLVASTALAALDHRAKAATARGAAARARSLHEEKPEHTEQRACAN